MTVNFLRLLLYLVILLVLFLLFHPAVLELLLVGGITYLAVSSFVGFG
jgi:hypothetical protein